jgi:hypothetical protein
MFGCAFRISSSEIAERDLARAPNPYGLMLVTRARQIAEHPLVKVKFGNRARDV